jgi:hypothetical protein
MLVVSSQGRGLFECTSGQRLARISDDDSGDPVGQDLSCDGIGVLTGTRVPIAGLLGGGLHRVTMDGWSVDVVAPDWPDKRVVLSSPFHNPYATPDKGGWFVVHDEDICELRAVGFSPSGNTFVAASSCGVSLWIR